jgi:Tfp pilus assembly ATPase PilU
MQTMNQALMLAVQDKAISVEEAINRSSNAGELEEMLNKTNQRASI